MENWSSCRQWKYDGIDRFFLLLLYFLSNQKVNEMHPHKKRPANICNVHFCSFKPWIRKTKRIDKLLHSLRRNSSAIQKERSTKCTHNFNVFFLHVCVCMCAILSVLWCCTVLHLQYGALFCYLRFFRSPHSQYDTFFLHWFNLPIY